jgi:hypothetical protein
VPTLLLLDRLFTHLASEASGATESPCNSDASAGSTLTPMPLVQETDIHLQDYNRSVLELVTFPNVLLAWCSSRPAHFHLTPLFLSIVEVED